MHQLIKANLSMMGSNFSTGPRLIVRRAAERRKTTYLKGPPFMNHDGWVLSERRIGERRDKLERENRDNWRKR